MTIGFGFRAVAACFLIIISTAFISLAVAKHSPPDNAILRVDDVLSRIASPETVKAVTADKQFQRNYLDAVQVTADLAKRLAEKFDSIAEVREASEHVEEYRRILASRIEADKSLFPRQLFGLGDGLDSSVVAGMSKAMGDVFSNIGKSLLADIGGAALFLGTGLGAGAAQGLKLAPASKTKEVAVKVASDNGQKATGLNPAIMNVAMGATAAITGAINVSSLTGSVGGSLDIKGLVLSLAEGLGNGSSAGLQLSPQAVALQVPPGNSTAAIAGAFGFGLTKTVTSNINTSALNANMLQNINISQLAGQPVSQIALSLAQGIGNGASSGLRLTQANLAPPAGDSVGDTLGAFGFGLVNSVTSNINTTNLLGQAKNTNINQLLGNVSLGQTGQSFGAGLGSGLAAGLKLTSALVDVPNPDSGDVPSVAGNFAFGLTKSIAENVNATMLMNSAASSGLTGSLDVGRVAQGAAMGFIQGAGDAVNSMGGLQALVNGTAMLRSKTVETTPMTFNDSVGGAAVGLGLGAGSQGTLVGVQLLSQLNVTSLISQITGDSTKPAAGGNANSSTPAVKRSYLLPDEIRRRQAQVGAISTDNSFNLSLIINAGTISQLGQRVIDSIGCEGIGGIALLALGLYESGTISLSSANSLNTTLIKQAIPSGILRFVNNGNIYTIDGTVVVNNIDSNILAAASGITVNGNPLVALIAFLVIHILFALLAFILLLPLALSLEATRNIFVRLGLKNLYASIPKWVNIIWIFLMGPLAILALIFGALVGGSSGHFRTAHGVLGLLTIITTLGGVFVHIAARSIAGNDLQNGVVFPRPFSISSVLTIRTILHQITLMLTLPTVIAGFSDLASVALCLTRVVPFEAGIAIASGLTFLYTMATALTGLTMYLALKDSRNAKKGKPAARLDIEAFDSNKEMKEKIRVIRQEDAGIHMASYSGQGRQERF